MSKSVSVKVPNKSGFDKSHQNLLTTKVGTLTPIFVDELIPNESVDLDVAISASLPPLASDTFMRCDLKLESFFVPTRILYGGYEKWLTGDSIWAADANDEMCETKVGIPVGRCNKSDYSTYTAPGTLWDFLGGKNPADASGGPSFIKFNIFPFLAYYKIYDDWYRNTQVQKPLFRPMDTYTLDLGTGINDIWSLPYRVLSLESIENLGMGDYIFGSSLGDGFYNDNGQYVGATKFGDLMQRNFGTDYFTNATPNPQLGDAKSVSFSITGDVNSDNEVEGEGSFTIAALRAMNSLQQFAERNALAGLRLQDYVKNNYGANLTNGVAQRAIYLGSESINVYSKGIYQTANFEGQGGISLNNPFTESVGAEFGSAQCSGHCNLGKFTADEPGYLMVIASLVPTVTYSSGINRILGRYNAQNSQTDMANPLLQNVGNQPIYVWELNGTKFGVSNDVFGYTDRYADFKNMNDEVHGLLKDGQNLQSFALQRTFVGSPVISDSFLRIPTNYLDQVAAVQGSISQYGVWIDSFFKYRVSMPLSEYSIPSLQDPAYEHGHDVTIQMRGSRID